MAKKRTPGPRSNYEIYMLLKLGHYRVVGELIAEGLLDVSRPFSITDYMPKSPLHVSAGFSKVRVARVLLEAGADPNSREHFERRTPLMSTACPLVAELLLAYGADPRLVDDEGRTALDHARSRGHERLAALLERHLLELEAGEPAPRARKRRM